MKVILVIIFLTFGIYKTTAQGIFTEKGKFSADAGFGYIISDDFNALSYNLSASLLGVIDLGFNYFRALPSDNFKRAEGNTGYIDFFVKKDSLYGIVLNMAFSTVNYESAFLAGLSIYSKLNSLNGFPFNIAPYFSLGYLTTDDIAAGFGIAVERKINKNLSIVITPAVNAGNLTQIVLGLEFIVQ